MVFLGRAAPALAAEGEAVLSASAGHGLLFEGDRPLVHVPGAEATAWIGLTDSVWLAASSGAAWRIGRQDGERFARAMGTAEAGIVVALDVFRTLPFLELMGGASLARSVEPTFRVGLGVDYFVSRTLSVGAVLRFRPLWDDVGRTSLFTASLRLATRIEL